MENKKDLFDRYCLRWVSKLEEDEKVMVGFNGDNGIYQSHKLYIFLITYLLIRRSTVRYIELGAQERTM